jgi:hypothetical protein
MKFQSPTEQPIFIALTTGHTCVIGPALIEVEPRFHREAVARGAIPEGMAASVALVGGHEATTTELIAKAVRAMVADADGDEFGNDGRPKATAISKRVGFTVSREQRDAAWAELEKDDA